MTSKNAMTFQNNKESTDKLNPAVWVTNTEKNHRTLRTDNTQQRTTDSDLRGFFFDLHDDSIANSLRVGNASPGYAGNFQSGHDTVKDLGHGDTMQGLLGSGGGYDAGLEIGSEGVAKDDIRNFSFTLSAS